MVSFELTNFKVKILLLKSFKTIYCNKNILYVPEQIQTKKYLIRPLTSKFKQFTLCVRL